MRRALKVCGFENAAVRIIYWINMLLFSVLSISSLFFTRIFPADYGEEIPVNQAAVFPLTFLGAFCISALIMVFCRYITSDTERQERNVRILLRVVLCWVLMFGISWVFLSKSVPVSDQYMVATSAERFAQGNFGRFEYGKYLYYYPSQLGLAAYEELIFRVVGSWELGIRMLQLLNVVGMAVGLIAGYRITRYLFQEIYPAVCFLLLYGICFPFLLYSVYVYGDVPAIALSFVAIWQLLRYLKEEKKSAVWLMTLALGAAVLVRNNSLIVLLACMCVLGVLAVSKKSLKYFLSILLLAAVTFGSSRGLKAVYEARSGLEIHDGVPPVLWIAMGMQEGDKEAGWYNGYSMYTYQDICQYNGEIAAELGKGEIRSRAKEFLKNPVYAVDFYTRKLTSQWNEPTYGCFMMTFAAEEERGNLVRSIFFGNLNRCLRGFMDSYQFLIYGMVLVLLYKKRKTKGNLEFYVLLIAVLGGVLFHLLWEAKSRYVLPYFVMMLPMAAGGMYQINEMIRGWGTKDEAAKAGR